MIDFNSFERAACTREEKGLIVDIVNMFAALSEKVCRDGLPSLEEDRDALPDKRIAYLLGLAIDGFPPADIRTIGETAIASFGYSGLELLAAMVVVEGCVSLANGDRPSLVLRKLAPCLGKDIDLIDDEMEGIDGHASPTDGAAKAADRKLDFEGLTADIRAKLRLSPAQSGALGALALSECLFESLEPDVLAAILLYLDEAARRRVLRALSPGKRAAAIGAICEYEEHDADSFLAIAHEALGRLVAGLEGNYRPSGGPRVAASLLKSLGGRETETVLEALGSKAPEAAKAIRQRLFLFEDLSGLDDRSIQKLLRKVDAQRLALAMKGAGAAVMEKVCSAMSDNAAEMLREDIEYMGPVLVANVKEARSSIVELVKELEREGEIIIGNSWEGDEYIQ
jgi:hypothetical protein